MKLHAAASSLIWLTLACRCLSERFTAATDYGFGPLFIDPDVEGDKLERCQELSINLGGGFAPYRLTTVNAENKSTPIPLASNNKSATWRVALSTGSHVAFNLTDRAGATMQTDLFSVEEASLGVHGTCGNDTAFIVQPKEGEEESSSSGSGGSSSGSERVMTRVNTRVGVTTALVVAGLAAFGVVM